MFSSLFLCHSFLCSPSTPLPIIINKKIFLLVMMTTPILILDFYFYHYVIPQNSWGGGVLLSPLLFYCVLVWQLSHLLEQLVLPPGPTVEGLSFSLLTKPICGVSLAGTRRYLTWKGASLHISLDNCKNIPWPKESKTSRESEREWRFWTLGHTEQVKGTANTNPFILSFYFYFSHIRNLIHSNFSIFYETDIRSKTVIFFLFGLWF